MVMGDSGGQSHSEQQAQAEVHLCSSLFFITVSEACCCLMLSSGSGCDYRSHQLAVHTDRRGEVSHVLS